MAYAESFRRIVLR